MGQGVPEPVPVEETRGGEEPGDWKVAASAAAEATAIREQLAVMARYIKQKYGEGNAE